MDNPAETTTYPAWQKTIREAQAKAEEKRIAAQQEAEEDAKALSLTQAIHLRRALEYLGIAAEPTENKWLADGISFHLWAVYEGNSQIVLEFEGDGKRPRFNLRVRAVTPDGYVNPNDWGQPRYRVAQTLSCRWVNDWSERQARLAQIIDEVCAERDRMIGEIDYARFKAEEEPPEPTLAEQLQALLHQMIQAELPQSE